MQFNNKINRKNFIKKAGLLAVAGMAYKASAEVLVQSREQEDISLPTNVKSVIFINMAGGMSHVDTFDPKPGNPKFGMIRASNGSSVSSVMPKFAKQLKHLNLVRTLHSQEGSHERGSYLIHTGHRPNAAFQDIPGFGAIIAYAQSSRMAKNDDYFPTHITLGSKGRQIGKGGFLGIEYDSFHIGNPDRPLNNLEAPGAFRNDSDYMRSKIVNLINSDFETKVSSKDFLKWKSMQASALKFMNSKKLSTFDITKESKKNQERFGNTQIGKMLLLTKRLAQIQTPFIEITIGGWDTHNNNSKTIRDKWGQIDQPLAALIEELAGSGLLSQTMFMINSEFGRTVEIRADRDGRDHYPQAWTAVVGGGNLPKGAVFGETDKKGAKPIKDPVSVSKFLATVYKAAGVDCRKSLYTTSGRPFPIIDNPEFIPGFVS